MPFDPEAFKLVYPQFINISDAALTYLNGKALSYYGFVTNGVTDPNIIMTLQYDVTAHLAALTQNSAVGRVSNASEGSVSVSLDYPSNPDGAWWNQTQYGAGVWQLIMQRGGFEFIPSPQRFYRRNWNY